MFKKHILIGRYKIMILQIASIQMMCIVSLVGIKIGKLKIMVQKRFFRVAQYTPQ